MQLLYINNLLHQSARNNKFSNSQFSKLLKKRRCLLKTFKLLISKPNKNHKIANNNQFKNKLQLKKANNNSSRMRQHKSKKIQQK